MTSRPLRRRDAGRSAMNKDDHRIFLAGLDFRGRDKPSLNTESVLLPLEVLGLTPDRRLTHIVIRELLPFTYRSEPDLGRRFKITPDDGCVRPTFRDGKVREVSKGMDTFRAFPDRSRGVIS